MQDPGKHLSIDELEHLANLAEPSAVVELEPAQRHLTECAYCRHQLELLQQADRRLRALRTSVPASRTAACPDEQEWLRVAAGLLRPDEQQARLDHAANCDHCGPLLRQAAEDFSDDLAPADESLLRLLSTSSREASRNLAERLVRSRAGVQGMRKGSDVHEAETPQRRWFAWPVLNYAAATVAAVAAVALVFWPTPRPPTELAEHLLAQAYTEQRTMELRIPGAAHAPVRVERGPERSRLSRPPALLEAEALIARQLRNGPNHADWWHMRGRAELLDWKYEAAIKSLKRALDSQPDSASIKTDLATAYFQRAEAEERAIDYGMTIELLGQILARNPNDLVALYNRALAEERMFLYNQAIADWESYLRVDPQGAWAAEVKERLESLRKKLKAAGSSATQPPASPRDYLQLVDSNGAGPEALLEAGVEYYVERAIREWMPAAYPFASSETQPPNLEARRALAVLAERLRRKHSDTWLSDLLATRPSVAYAAGVDHLSKAVTLNARNQPEQGRLLALRARESFQQVGSQAGVLRSEIEAVYSLQRAGEIESCGAAADALARTLRERDYRWIRIQAHLEQGICAFLAGRHGTAQRHTGTSLELSRSSRYGLLELRTLGMMAESAAFKGDWVTAWSRNREGLTSLWNRRYSSLRAYQFYAHLAHMADVAEKSQLALVLHREAARVSAGLEDRNIEPQERIQLGAAAVKAGEPAEATAEFESAAVLFAALPPNEVTASFERDAQLWLAELEADQKEWSKSRARLLRVRNGLMKLADYDDLFRYYRLAGEIDLRLGRLQEAEESFTHAVRIDLRTKSNLQSERDRIIWEQLAESPYRGLVRIRLREGDFRGAFHVWQWYKASAGQTQKEITASATGLSALALEARPLPIPEIGLASFKGSTLISYVQFEDGFAVWVVDDRGVEYQWVAVKSEQLAELTQRFREACARPESDQGHLKSISRQLYELVLAPVGKHLSPERVLILEPDLALRNIPFAALMDAHGHYLGEQFSMVLSSGINLRHPKHLASTVSVRQRVLVIGDPASGGAGGAYPPLPDAIREAESVASRFLRPTVLSGKLATRSALEHALAQAEIFHFAGHAIAGGDSSGLLVAAGADGSSKEASTDMVQASGIPPDSAPYGRLAVLSSCSTGAGKSEQLVDPDDLVRALHRAGFSEVVASGWNVDSRATAFLMDAFYDSLLSGRSTPQAWQSAAAVMRQRPETAHPYYWAAFSVFRDN